MSTVGGVTEGNNDGSEVVGDEGGSCASSVGDGVIERDRRATDATIGLCNRILGPKQSFRVPSAEE